MPPITATPKVITGRSRRAAVFCLVFGCLTAAGCPGRPQEERPAVPDPPAKPFTPPPLEEPEPLPREAGDLTVVRAGGGLRLGDQFGDCFAKQALRLPGVLAVSGRFVDTAKVVLNDGRPTPQLYLVLGCEAHDFDLETLEVVAGRPLAASDRHKILLDTSCVPALEKKVGDRLTFAERPGVSFEIVGLFKQTRLLAGIILPLEDAQAVFGKAGRITRFAVRVKKEPDPAAAVGEAKAQIEALRDPDEPEARVTAVPNDRP